MQKQLSNKGFTLIEISIVLMIVGIIISVVGSILPSIINTSKIKRTNATLEKFDYSLQGYMIANNRLPCPDTDGDGRENLTGGAGTDCAQYSGDFPYIDVGVSSANDPFSNPIGYAVYGAAGAGQVDLTNTYADASDFLNNGLNAANAEIAAAGGFTNTKVYTTFSDTANTVDNATSTGQAYVLVSGGQRDINAPAGFYDHLNFSGNTQFAAPNKINTDLYDDSVLAQNPTFLAGKHFVGGGGGGGTSTALENTNALCMDGSDNDGNGSADCADASCSTTAHCTSQTNVTVAGAPPLPIGTVGSIPSYTFTASGGSSTPLYYWTINSISSELNGDLGVNYFTGQMTGSYDACPGNYSLTVRADDRNDGSNFDTETFSITINSGSIGILPLPSGGTDYNVDSALFEQTFSMNGNVAGNVQWSINWTGGDPGGLSLQTSDDTSKLVKTGTSTSGTYGFTLSVTDSECPTNTYTSPTYALEVSGGGAAAPINAGLVAEWRFNEASWGSGLDEVIDSHSSNLHGTARNGLNTSTFDPAKRSIPGTCSYAEFDGSNDYISLGNPGPLNFSGNITISAWIRPDSTSGLRNIVNHGYRTGPNQEVLLRINNNRYEVGSWSPYAGVTFTIPSGDIGNWIHLTGVYNGTSWQIYRNATLVASNNATQGAIPVDAEWYIGGRPGTSRYFDGGIDEVRIYNRALDATEIAEVMNLNNDCIIQPSVLPSCGLTPNNGILMSTYNQTGASHPANASAFDNVVSTYATPANLFGSGVQAQINGFGNPYGTDDRYLSLFQGYIEVPENGYYTFAVDGDDAVDISINGNAVTGWYGGHGRSNSPRFPVTVPLQAGFHDLLFRHEEIGGGDSYFMYSQLPTESSLNIAPGSLFKYCP